MAVTVKITRRTVMRPPPALASSGGGRTAPLTAFDRASTDGYIPIVFAWSAPTPDNGAIVDGLLATVARYPPLLGRMGVDDDGRKCFVLNDAGVLVIEAEADVDLADALAHDVAAHVNELYPKANKERDDEPLFQVQLTRYKCGGLAIGTVSQHLVADGQSISIFFTAWATTVRTNSAALPSPVTDRTTIAIPRSPPAPEFDHGNTEFRRDGHGHSYGTLPMDRIRNLSVHFPEEFVAGLKARVGGRCSTFQCLLAHAWKKITAARDLAPDEFTQIRVAVNCRPRASPPAPMEYSGPGPALWAFPRMRVRDLLSASLATVVGVIRDAVARVDANYIQSFVDFGEIADRAEEELASTAATPGMSFCPDLEVDSWLGFRFHDLDFGHGPPCAFLPPSIPIEGILIFVPSCSAKGGMDLFMTLDDEHVEAFEQICHKAVVL